MVPDFLIDLKQLIQTRFLNASGIIYCQKRETCDTLAADLAKNGIVCKAYHAALNKQTKTEVQEAWQVGTIPLIICTIAFGMGIDVLLSFFSFFYLFY